MISNRNVTWLGKVYGDWLNLPEKQLSLLQGSNDLSNNIESDTENESDI